MEDKIANNINILGTFCGKRDINELTSACLKNKYGIEKADVMALFGGSFIFGGNIMAAAIKNKVAFQGLLTTMRDMDQREKLYCSCRDTGVCTKSI